MKTFKIITNLLILTASCFFFSHQANAANDDIYKFATHIWSNGSIWASIKTECLDPARDETFKLPQYWQLNEHGVVTHIVTDPTCLHRGLLYIKLRSGEHEQPFYEVTVTARQDDPPLFKETVPSSRITPSTTKQVMGFKVD